MKTIAKLFGRRQSVPMPKKIIICREPLGHGDSGVEVIEHDDHDSAMPATKLICCECIAGLVNAGGKPLNAIYGANRTPWQTGTCEKCGKDNETLAPYPVDPVKISGLGALDGNYTVASSKPVADGLELSLERTAKDFRTLKAMVPSIEFGAVQWAAKRCLVQHENGKVGPMALERFMREALLAKLREVVRDEIAKGKPVPPDIAAVLDQKRSG